MPWKELCTVNARESFVLRASEPGANMSALCREYGVSRKTGYKWLERYREGGLKRLEDASRRPDSSPLNTSAEVAVAVVSVRTRWPNWGARKIQTILGRELRKDEIPSVRTINRILERSGLIQRRRKRRQERNAPNSAPRVEVRRPNDLWTVDFKGWWLSACRDRCEPLTVRDARSRYLLGIDVMSDTRLEPARAVFERLFSTYGLPKAILTDNGTPFAHSRGRVGLTRLSAWWLALGIEHVRTRPGKPCDNGGHERMHRDIAEEVGRLRALPSKAQQRACDRWRHDFNHHRPHEALGMRTPADVYRRSAIRFTGQPIMLDYPDDQDVRPVASSGEIRCANARVFVASALAGWHVGVEPLSSTRFAVWFAHRRIGEVLTLNGSTRFYGAHQLASLPHPPHAPRPVDSAAPAGSRGGLGDDCFALDPNSPTVALEKPPASPQPLGQRFPLPTLPTGPTTTMADSP